MCCLSYIFADQINRPDFVSRLFGSCCSAACPFVAAECILLILYVGEDDAECVLCKHYVLSSRRFSFMDQERVFKQRTPPSCCWAMTIHTSQGNTVGKGCVVSFERAKGSMPDPKLKSSGAQTSPGLWCFVASFRAHTRKKKGQLDMKAGCGADGGQSGDT